MIFIFFQKVVSLHKHWTSDETFSHLNNVDVEINQLHEHISGIIEALCANREILEKKWSNFVTATPPNNLINGDRIFFTGVDEKKLVKDKGCFANTQLCFGAKNQLVKSETVDMECYTLKESSGKDAELVDLTVLKSLLSQLPEKYINV